MSYQYQFAACVAFCAMLAVGGARAQYCDERYPWTCPGYARGFPESMERESIEQESIEQEPIERQPLPPYAISPNPWQPRQPVYRQPDYWQPHHRQPGYRQQEPSLPGDTALTLGRQYAVLYASVSGERFPVPALKLSEVGPEYLRKIVSYPTQEPPGTIIVDPQSRFLYLVQGGGLAIRYGVGVGREGFGWSGTATIRDKQEWPDWYPPKEMIRRQPELQRQLRGLQGGLGLPGGPRNPLGARALYLWQGGKDTLFRIHGTAEPWTIGTSVSSGCIRMINQDVIDLFERTPVGTKVVVLSG